MEQGRPGDKDAAKILSRYRDFKNDRSLSVYAFSREGQFRELTAGILNTLGVTFHKHKTVKKLDLVYYAAKETGKGRSNLLLLHQELGPWTNGSCVKLSGEIGWFA